MKKIIALALSFILFFTPNIFANQDATSSTPDAPSTWAAYEVTMATTNHLGEENSYQGFQKQATVEDFLKFQASLEKSFEIQDPEKIQNQTITRGEVLKELYDIIGLALKLPEPAKDMDGIVKYFVENKLMNGRGNNEYQLDQIISKEEVIIFAKRVYDHIVYGLGKESKGVFWKVSDEDNTVYLLGSIHVADTSTYPINKEILNSFAKSNVLVVEANIENMMSNPEIVAYLQKIMKLDGDQTIDQLISKDLYKIYVEKMTALKVAPEFYNKLKPWYASLLLQATATPSENANHFSPLGIDMYFLKLATGKMPIAEVEGAKYQFDMFDSFAPEVQEQMLREILTNSQQAGNTAQNLINAWKAGDAKAIEKIAFAETGLEGKKNKTKAEQKYFDEMWVKRNAHMTEYVDQLLKDGHDKDYFFVVGSGHMVGEIGVIEGLKKMNYQVVPVQE